MDGNGPSVIRAQHDELQELFRRVSRPDEDRSSVLKAIMQTLSAHIALEKQLLEPALRDHVADSEALVDRLRDDHDRAERLLTRLGRRKTNSPDVPPMVTELMELTDGHVEEAEANLIPALEGGLDPQASADLGAALRSAEGPLLTHPHPLLPDSGPVAAVTRKVAGVVDRVRDHATDVGRADS